MKKLAAACVSAALVAVLAVGLAVIAATGSGAHQPAPTAGSSWAKFPPVTLPSLGALGSILGL